ncbi:hypothetical protein MIMGU_mgv1a0128292mg, partial [Erythranthe guttata]
ISE